MRVEIVDIEVALVVHRPQMGDRTTRTLENIGIMDEKVLTKRALKAHREKYIKGLETFNNFMWYAKAIREELKAIGADRKLRVTHVRVESGQSHPFNINGHQYHGVLIIVGTIEEHYYYVDAANGISSHERRFRPHLEALLNSRVLSCRPLEPRCPRDYCRNNCKLCRSHEGSPRGYCSCNDAIFKITDKTLNFR
ncbi:hypothetical protein DMENIID0001_157810 [Sergentomyia squamirostris]